MKRIDLEKGFIPKKGGPIHFHHTKRSWAIYCKVQGIVDRFNFEKIQTNIDFDIFNK